MPVKHFILTLLFILTSIACAPSITAQGNTYYVATNGIDGPGRGTAALPWRTIQYAAGQVQAGDTVLINPGTYTGGITVDTSGTASEPITFRANGAGVIIEGSGGERDAFFITWADYVVVEGLTIQHATRAGMRIDNSHHVTVRDCTFANNGTWGLFTDFSDYTTVENCESYGAIDQHGIYISNSSDYPIIRGNRLHHNHDCGLHMNGDISMGGDGIISHALVENNIIYENGTGGGSGINMDGVTDSVIRNNLLYNNHASGISLYQIDGGSGSQNNRVLNNTIVMASDGRWGINIPGAGDTNNKLFNNIIYSYHSWRGSITIGTPTLSGFESDHNVVMDRFSTDDGDTRITLAQWQALGYDQHPIIATPGQLFVNASAADYHLTPGSPAIDKGTTLNDVPTDLEGNLRPTGTAYDIGAYEFQPALVLSGKAGNQIIYLNWSLNTTLLAGSAWGITYYSQTAASAVSVSNIVSPTRAYTLTSLTNYFWYTVTLNAVQNATPFLTDTVHLMPTNILVYLPLVLRAN
jgi:parallel beta-helix repeat protein